MNIVTEKTTLDKTQNDTPKEDPQGCLLGRELGNCPLQRRGCGSLYQALMYAMPPYHVRLLVREQLAGDSAAQAWLRRLDDILPEQRATITARREGWR